MSEHIHHDGRFLEHHECRSGEALSSGHPSGESTIELDGPFPNARPPKMWPMGLNPDLVGDED